MGRDELFESVATALASIISLKFGPVADPHRRHADPIWPPQSQNRISDSPRSIPGVQRVLFGIVN
jgi:hypothetical protein